MWRVLVRREVRPVIDAVKGKKSGYPDAYRQLTHNPCVEFPDERGDGTRPFAYRLSGPLEAKVCGVHLKGGDMWTVVHDILSEENPPEDHLRPPCCQHGLPGIDEDELADVMARLRRLTRGR